MDPDSFLRCLLASDSALFRAASSGLDFALFSLALIFFAAAFSELESWTSLAGGPIKSSAYRSATFISGIVARMAGALLSLKPFCLQWSKYTTPADPTYGPESSIPTSEQEQEQG